MNISLPEPFDGLDVGAYIEHGRRHLTWTLLTPGELHRNRYRWAWIHISEREPFRGEPLWLSATRRTDENYSREAFTDKGREALSRQLLPIVARYGFDRLWTDTHRSRVGTGDGGIVAARRLLDWHERARDVRAMHQAGLTALRPVRDVFGSRPTTVSCPCTGVSGWASERVIASVHVDGEQVGWMTDRGDVVPAATTAVTA